MRVFEIGMHWFPEGGGGADRYFYGLVSELAHHDCALKAFVFGEGKSDPRDRMCASWEAGTNLCGSVFSNCAKA